MKLIITENEIKDAIIAMLDCTLKAECMMKFSREEIKFRREVGDDINGWYMEEIETAIEVVFDDV